MRQEEQTVIRIKGVRDGILVGLDDAAPLESLLPQLESALAGRQSFLKGSRIVLEVGHRPLARTQLSAIQALLATNDLELWTVLADVDETREAARGLGLATRLAGSNTDLQGNALEEDDEAHGAWAPSQDPAANGLLLHETIRSGRSIYYEGHVTIIGDVNPGAEVIAAGNVIVWGRLRGLVHAGALGDAGALICALSLVPTQLRIADQIAIPPDERVDDPGPEMAAIRDGRIVAEPWQVRD